MTSGSTRRKFLIAAVALALPAATPAAEEAVSACPHFLQSWVVVGGFEAGDDWTTRLVTIRNDRARLEELRIRSEAPKPSDADSRWFMPAGTPDPEPVEVAVGTKVLLGDSLQAMCKELAAVGLGSIQQKALVDVQKRAAGGVDARRIEVTVTDVQEGMRVGVHATPAPEKPKPGVVAATNPGMRKESLVLAQEDLADDGDVEEEVDPKAPRPPPLSPDAMKARQRSKAILTAVRTITERYSRTMTAASSDFNSVPAARRILETLDGVDDAGLPSDLPSPFLLETAAAPREYAVALSLEVLAREDDEDGESGDRSAALRKLGDQATPVAVEDLVVVLLQPTKTKERQVDAALALRALLKADPEQARIQAVRLLSGPRPVALAALGVFAATENPFSQELGLLDLTDAKKILEVTARLKRHLAETATDPALRKAAGGV